MMSVQNRPGAGTIGVWALAIGLASGVLSACDTPVYRYALYRWTPTPYILCRIHQGAEENASVAEVREAVERAADDPSLPANIVWVDVDARQTEQMEAIPGFVRQRWESRPPGTTAAYYLVAPHGAIIDSHDWTPDEIGQLLHSPLRRSIGEALEADKAGVVILLDHPGKPKANQAAYLTIQRTLDKIRKGELELATAPSVKNPDVALLRLSKDDAREAWLIRQLLEVESDLSSVDEPIVFVLFGRGRALFSCLGKGITEENLARDVEFVSGACSCTVKEQNPGVDLLMRYDWENAATVVAEKHGGETGTDALLDGDQLFPELALSPGDQPVDSDSENGAGGIEESGSSQAGSDQRQAESERSVDGDATAESDAADLESDTKLVSSDNQGVDSSDDSEAASVEGESHRALASRAGVSGSGATDRAPVATRIGLWRVALGLGVALLGMFVVTFLVLRPRSG